MFSRRNESDPCNINLLGQELDDVDDLSRPELRSHPHGLDPLSQSTFEPSTQGHDVLLKDSEMCRSASFNAHPRAASPLLLRKETFLKQKTSPQHQALVSWHPHDSRNQLRTRRLIAIQDPLTKFAMFFPRAGDR